VPSDVELLVNYGDYNIKRAEIEMQANQESSESQAWVVAKEFYTKAFQMYEQAWNIGNATVGDDISGLLQNWGAGLASFAEVHRNLAILQSLICNLSMRQQKLLSGFGFYLVGESRVFFRGHGCS
jgi:hypothetical protein